MAASDYQKVDSWECLRCGVVVVSRQAHDRMHNNWSTETHDKSSPLTKEAHEQSGERISVNDSMRSDVRLRSDGEWPV
jgi:molybdopterin biosynthesis enzyme MoaB